MKSTIVVIAATLFLASIVGAQVAPPEEDITAQTPPEVDPIDDPLARLNEARAALAAIDGASAELDEASERLDRAYASLVAIEPNLRKTLSQIRVAQRNLESAARGSSDEELIAEVGRIQVLLFGVGRLIANDVLEIATSAGVDRLKLASAQASLVAGDSLAAASDHDGAMAFYVKTLKIKNSLEFDIVSFISQVQQDLTFATTGFSVAVNKNGKLVDSFAHGLRQTIVDSNPVIPLGVTDEVHLASVSKTLTAVGVLYQLQQMGPDVADLLDDPIGPFLPPHWDRGEGIDDVTFEQLLMQKSGLGGRDEEGNRRSCGTSWDGLKDCVALGAKAEDKTYHYNNGNLALFRVMLYYMQGGACTKTFPLPEFCDSLTATIYRLFMQCTVFAKMGIASKELSDEGDCEGPDLLPELSEGAEALLYDSREPLLGGVSAGDWTQTGGGGGWYMSAIELAQLLAHLRYNTKILKPETRELMYARFLGWPHPDGWSGYTAGKFGTYRMYGGGVCYPQQGAEGDKTCFKTKEPGNSTCIADLPGGVQAVLLINSRRGDYGEACSVVKRAYEAAWVAK